jgi:hypothetical protein
MQNRFENNQGGTFSNAVLSDKIKEHAATKAYLQDLIDDIIYSINAAKGDVYLIPGTQLNSYINQNHRIDEKKYGYATASDKLSGLSIMVHGWTEARVELIEFKLTEYANVYSYTCKLKFTLIDNFGLDAGDLGGPFTSSAYRSLGFNSWYALQHYDKYTLSTV